MDAADAEALDPSSDVGNDGLAADLAETSDVTNGTVNGDDDDAKAAIRTRVSEPFGLVLLPRLEAIAELVVITKFALRSIDGAARLATALKKSPDHVAEMAEVEAKAAAQVSADYPLLNSSAAVLLWGGLEVSIRDFIVRWFHCFPTARTIPELDRVRVKVAEYESLEGEDRMRFLVHALERETGAGLRPGVARFEVLLHPLGVIPTITGDHRRNLNELAAVRNVIVHRAGVADDRLVGLCPWLGLTVGQAVPVTSDSVHRYHRAVAEYAASVLDAAFPKDHAAPPG